MKRKKRGRKPGEVPPEIVPWRQYLGRLAGRSTAWLFIGVMFFVATVGLLLVALMAWAALTSGLRVGLAVLLFFAAIVGGLSAVLARMGVGVAKEMRSLPPIEPLTPRNAALLPETDTLVRASDEPEALQAAVLLRAAHAAYETPAAQLLRASGTVTPLAEAPAEDHIRLSGGAA